MKASRGPSVHDPAEVGRGAYVCVWGTRFERLNAFLNTLVRVLRGPLIHDPEGLGRGPVCVRVCGAQ